jgi:cardiolipin synthase
MMHSKAVIVDEHVALFGSPNMDQRSLFVNFEIGVVVHSAPEVRAMREWAADLAGHCHPPKPERKHRFLGHLAEDLSRLLAPLL